MSVSSRDRYLTREPKLELARKLKIVIWILTIVVLALVLAMRMPNKLDVGIDFSFLPPVHAAINTAVAVLLITAILTVKLKLIFLHKLAINIAMLFSVAFLLCYVAYHFTVPETLFGDLDHNGELSEIERMGVVTARPIYLAILLSHIALAALSFPLILFTWMFGYTNQFDKHRVFAKITFPMWLYVAVTGPICYYMLKSYYP